MRDKHGSYSPSIRLDDGDASLRKGENARNALIAGRVAAIAAILTFAACYLGGIFTYGLLLTVGLGWLPAGIVAWAVALVAASLTTSILQFSARGWGTHSG